MGSEVDGVRETVGVAGSGVVRRDSVVMTDDGVALAVASWGFDKPGLLMVHGFGGAKEDFADHAPSLAEHFTVVTFDHRGHGSSDKPDALEAYSFERLRTDTLAVADAFGFDTFVLLGHSMGGMIVRGIAIDQPQRLRALIMMDTTAGPVPGFAPDLMNAAAQIALDEGKDVLKKLLDEVAPLETEPHLRTLRERPDYAAINDKKWNDLSVMMWASLGRAIGSQSDDLNAMRTLTMPVLVMVGDADTPFIEPSKAMTAAIPNAQLAVIDNAGHSPQYESPLAWNTAIDAFLAELT